MREMFQSKNLKKVALVTVALTVFAIPIITFILGRNSGIEEGINQESHRGMPTPSANGTELLKYSLDKVVVRVEIEDSQGNLKVKDYREVKPEGITVKENSTFRVCSLNFPLWVKFLGTRSLIPVTGCRSFERNSEVQIVSGPILSPNVLIISPTGFHFFIMSRTIIGGAEISSGQKTKNNTSTAFDYKICALSSTQDIAVYLNESKVGDYIVFDNCKSYTVKPGETIEVKAL